jgi:hypothetical protein
MEYAHASCTGTTASSVLAESNPRTGKACMSMLQEDMGLSFPSKEEEEYFLELLGMRSATGAWNESREAQVQSLSNHLSFSSVCCNHLSFSSVCCMC